MAKKLSSDFNFLGYAPNENLLDPAVSQAKLQQAVSTNPNLFKSYYSEELFRPKLEAIQREREIERLRNVDVNSFNVLAKKAGLDESYASGLYNRVQELPNLPLEQSTSAYNALALELDELKEKGTTNSFGGIDYLADFREGFYEAAKGLANLFRDDKQFSNPEKFLGKSKNDPLAAMSLDVFTPSDIYDYAKRVLDRKQKEVSLKKFKNQLGGSDQILDLIESKSRNLKSTNGFDDLLMPALENQFVNPGSEWYREAGDDLSQQYVDDFRTYVRNGFKENLDGKDFFTAIGNKRARYAKYDLEKETLNDYKSILQQDLYELADQRRTLIDQKKLEKDSAEDKVYQEKMTRINSALDKLVSREKVVDQVYGVQVGDRSGITRSLLGNAYSALVDTTRFLLDFNPFYEEGPTWDADWQVAKNSLYKPEVLRYDKFGNPVLSNQIFYESASGSKANWSGFFESGGAIIGDMVPAILVGGALGRVVSAGLELAGTAEAGASFGSRLASSSAKAYDKVNRYGSLRLADRASTFATIYGTVQPKMYDQEKKWGGNAKDRSRFLAVAEAASEAIGFPDVGVLKINRFSRGLGAAAKTSVGLNLTRSEITKAYLRGGAEFAKTAVKANLVESFEEEMSLLGEALVSEAYADEYEKVGREKTEFSGENIIDTFTEAFKGGLLYSGLMTGRNHYRVTRKDALLDQAEYEAAINPELFKAKLKETHKRNPEELSEKQLADAIVTIDNLSNTFKGLSQIDNLKDLNTFFEDEESRRRLFSAARRRETLMQIDFDTLTDEQKEDFSKAKLGDKVISQATKEYNKVRQQIADLTARSQTEKLTKEQAMEFLGLQMKAEKLRGISNTIDVRKLTNAQMETLASLGLIQDKDFQFTQEDLTKMIEDVDTEILKTEKRAFEYAQMSKAEKAEAIKKAYQKKIDAIGQVSDPALLFQQLQAVKQDFEYLEKNVPNINPEILANKQALIDAYTQKFDSLTQVNEAGTNAFEDSLRDLDIDKAVADYNIYDLVKLSALLDNNLDHVDESFAENLNDSLLNAQAQIIENINKLTGDQKIEALAKIMDQTVKFNTVTYFDQKSFSQFLASQFIETDQAGTQTEKTLEVPITPEEFEKVRSELIRIRGIRKSVSMASTGRVDGVSSTTDAEYTEDALRTMARNAANASAEVDETGESDRTSIEKQYIQSFLKRTSLADAVGALKERVGAMLNVGSAKAGNLLNILDNYLKTKDLAAFNAEMASFKSSLTSEIQALRSRDKNSKAANALEGVLQELNLWQKTVTRMVIQNPATDFSNLTAPTQPPVTPPGQPPVDSGEFSGKPEVIEEEDFTTDQITTKQAEIDQLDQEAQRRRTRLVDLTSPARSNGIETEGESNKINEDPAVKRRVAFINELSSMPDTKIKVLNKKQFLREFLAAKFPNKTSADIEQDLKTIQSFFETLPPLTVSAWDTLENKDAVLSVIYDLLGTEFFDKGQIAYYVKNKGKGLITTPEVIMTAATPDGKIILQDSYPLELSFVLDNGQNNQGAFAQVPWKLSRRIQDETQEFKIQPGDLVEAHKDTFTGKKAIKAFLEKNDSSIMVDFEISEGVVTPGDSKIPMAISESSAVVNASLTDFHLPTAPGTEIAGRFYKYNLGRLYFNNNGNPVLLGNTKLSENEIEAIAELVFSQDPSLIDTASLDAALFDLVNQINKDERIVFFPPQKQMQILEDGSTRIVVDSLLSPSKVTLENGQRVYKKLSKEEFIKELGNYYYKASPKYLQGGEMFNRLITRFEMRDNKPNVYQQTYLGYIKETHTIPVDSTGNVSNLVNKVVYLDSAQIDQQGKVFKLKQENGNKSSSNANTRSKQNPVPKKEEGGLAPPTLSRKVSEGLNLLPYNEINNFLKSLNSPIKINYSEAVYDSILTAIKADPSILKLSVVNFDQQTQSLILSDYTGNSKGSLFVLGVVTLNNQKYKVFLQVGKKSQGTNLNVFIEGTNYVVSAVPTTPVSTAPTPTPAPVSNIEARRAELENLKSLVNSTKDITSKMNDIFRILDEGKYMQWQDSIDTVQLEKDLRDKVQSVKSEGEIANIITKYLLPKFIDEELAALGKTTQSNTGPTMSIEELQAAADSTSQSSKSNTPTGQVFTKEEQDQAKQKSEGCKTDAVRPSQVASSKTPNLRRRK